jgi:hypothetical protein
VAENMRVWRSALVWPTIVLQTTSDGKRKRSEQTHPQLKPSKQHLKHPASHIGVTGHSVQVAMNMCTPPVVPAATSAVGAGPGTPGPARIPGWA